MDLSIKVPTSSPDEPVQVSLDPIIQLAKDAGKVIMDIYETPTSDWSLQTKSDDSPLTKADLAANKVICSFLQSTYPSIPIMTEEAKADDYSLRSKWRSFWCVDPLDGTKEFIKRNGEFTVNIALMQTGIGADSDQSSSSPDATPILGVVYAPVLQKCYFAVKDCGAFVMTEEKNNVASRMQVKTFSESDECLVLVCSRSHLDDRTKKFLESFKNSTSKSMGSSLKFMLVANGDAHIYPRLAPTMEWDTAASQIIVTEAGGEVINAETNKPLMYNKEQLRNPFFYVYGKRTQS